jgi:toxin ParE1/3/4
VPSYRLAGPARRSIVAILRRSALSFGASARERYANLFLQAMDDVAADPRRPGVVEVGALRETLGLYHLKHARRHVTNPALKVGSPRHLIVFSVAEDGVVTILGVIHDRMLLEPALSRIIRTPADDAP